jgi:hypothetical protein
LENKEKGIKMKEYIEEVKNLHTTNKFVYNKTEGKSGRIWLIPDIPNCADYIHCSPKPFSGYSDGYAGRTITFPLTDNTTISIQGPWHSNSDDLYSDTGIDIRNKHLTFGIIALKRDPTTFYTNKYIGIFYKDKEPTVGYFDRIEIIAQEISNRLHIPISYYSQSTGGSCSSFVYPREETINRILNFFKWYSN